MRSASVCLAVALAVFAIGNCGRRGLHVDGTSPAHRLSVRAAVSLDLDRDGQDEIYLSGYPYDCLVDWNLAVLDSWPGARQIIFDRDMAVGDMDGDGSPDIAAVGMSENMSRVLLTVHNLKTGVFRCDTLWADTAYPQGVRLSSRIVRYAPALPTPSTLDWWDIDADGRDELAIWVSWYLDRDPTDTSAGYDLWDSLVVFDSRSGMRLAAGPQGNLAYTPGAYMGRRHPSVLVQGRDKLTRMVVLAHDRVSDAGSGVVGETTMCLEAISADANRIWTVPLSDSSALGILEVLQSPDRGQLVAVSVPPERRPDSIAPPGILHLFEPDSGIRVGSCSASHGGASFTDMMAVDVDDDGVSELLTLDSRGTPKLRDIKLRPIGTARFTDTVTKLVGSGRLAPGRQRQVIVLTKRNELLFLNKHLDVLCRYQLARDPVAVLLVDSCGVETRLFVSDMRHGVVVLRLVLEPPPSPLPGVAIGLAGAVILAFLALLYSGATYREFVRYVTRGMVERAGIVMFSRNGRVTSVNKRAAELLLLPKDVRTGVLDVLLSRQAFAALRVEFSKFKERKLPRAVADIVLEVDGSARTFRAALSRLRLGGFLLSLEDLAAVEYAKRVAAWGPVAQRLAHGIKTPLSTIKLTAQSVEDVVPGESKVIVEEADRLAKMTDGFMRLADFEPPRLESRDINAVVQRVLDELGIASLPGIELKLELAEGLPQVQLDEEQVVRALGNLVNNAIQAMQGKGRLAVATRQAETAAEVVVAVADSGPGIPPDYLAKLFQPFFTRKAGGTGLGLTIVRKVAEDHGGRVEVESEPGKGAMFRFILPVPKPVA